MPLSRSLRPRRPRPRNGHTPRRRPTGARPRDPGIAVEAVGLRRAFGSGAGEVVALDDIDVALGRGHFTAIMGASGSGKSTLMHCLSGLDTVDRGRIWIGDTELTALGDHEATVLRRDRIGFVFQAFNLLPALSARENIVLPLELAGRPTDPSRLADVCDRLGIAERLAHRPSELSGGQQQRVAIARALLPRPDVIFADEPTGNLDSRASGEVLHLLQQSAREVGQTVVMVTHDPVAASYADRVLVLTDGRASADLHAPSTDQIAAALQSSGA